ncbi:MAG: type III pantothenate kinase [Lachnospiraceae bacterium]|nr:type III pantothenate kinase [Lachnospiraceae bacterium]MDY5742563.1 type III pantothenate kinase [Lachnospiraceae bacterium]
MLLVIDIGNTNLTFGIYQETKLLDVFRLTTNKHATSDEYGSKICDLLERKGIVLAEITGAAVSSVVPDLMYSFTRGIKRYLGVTPFVVEPGIKTGIRISTENPKAVGADRIVDAVAAFELYGGPVLVVDFGTATTFDVITADGELKYGVIVPGIRITADALQEKAAKLPRIEIKRPQSILGIDTISAMQSGIYFGYIGLTEYMITNMKAELGRPDLQVVATGGLGRMIAEATDTIDIYNPELTLEGLRILYEKQEKRGGYGGADV